MPDLSQRTARWQDMPYKKATAQRFSSTENIVTSSVEGTASFFTTGGGTTVGQFNSEEFPELDKCEVFDKRGSPPPVEIPTAEFMSTTLDAGEVLTLRSSAGSYGEIRRQQGDDEQFFYSNGLVTLTFPVPEQLVVDVPGSGYPAFQSVPVPSVETFAIVNPELDAAVDRSTEFAWKRSDNPDASINIVTDNENFQVVCRAADDGTFTLSDAGDSLDKLPADFSGPIIMFSRTAETKLVNGNAALRVVLISGYMNTPEI